MKILIPTARYLKKPEIGVSQGIRDYLAQYGASNAIEVRRGISRDLWSSKFIITEVCTALSSMTKAGIVQRDGQFYTLDLRRRKAQKKCSKTGSLIATRMADDFVTLSKTCNIEIRNDVLSEMYLLMAGGGYKQNESKRLLEDAKKAVLKQVRNGWREQISTEKPIGDNGLKLLDIFADTSNEDEYLTSVEAEAELLHSVQE